MSESTYKIPHADSAVLVERFQDGDIEAFDEIVDRYRGDIYRIAYYFTRNCEDAYDISQEVFIKVFKSLSRLRKSSTFSLWLKRIVVNTCIDYLRKQSKEQSLDDSPHFGYRQAVNAYVGHPDSPMENRELRNVISEAVGQLPKRQKTVFTLRHYEDLSLKEIARTLRCPVGTVKANLFHATRNLRKMLADYVS
jgi:RNA polymerase sigma-70 factor (ECF subfamily)